MKPFDPKTAKNGDKVCFSNCDYVYTYVGHYPKQGYDGSVLMDQNSNLTFASNKFLYIPKTKRTVWVNVYKKDMSSGYFIHDYKDEQEAITYQVDRHLCTFVGTYPLEIEE